MNDGIGSDVGASYATTSTSIRDISLPPQDDEEEADEKQIDCSKFSDTSMYLELETNRAFSNRPVGG